MWQPIESAPKDGTDVLTWDGRTFNVSFFGRTDCYNRAAWVGKHCRVDHIDQPTHWMPLPVPPSQSGESRDT